MDKETMGRKLREARARARAWLGEQVRRFRAGFDVGVFAATLTLTLGLAALCLAQGSTTTQPPEQVGSTAWWAWVVAGVSGTIISISVQLFRKLVPNLPRVVVWALPLALGGIGTTLAQMAQTADVTTLQGVLLGTAAIAVRELVTTLKEHGING